MYGLAKKIKVKINLLALGRLYKKFKKWRKVR